MKRNHKEKKMRFIWQLFGLLFIGCSLILAGGVENPRVLINTELGNITIEIYEKDAPITAANFLKYVDEGRYKNGCFYRVVTMDNQPNNDIKIEVIQGGLRADARSKNKDFGYCQSQMKIRKIMSVQFPYQLHLDTFQSFKKKSKKGGVSIFLLKSWP